MMRGCAMKEVNGDAFCRASNFRTWNAAIESGEHLQDADQTRLALPDVVGAGFSGETHAIQWA